MRRPVVLAHDQAEDEAIGIVRRVFKPGAVRDPDAFDIPVFLKAVDQNDFQPVFRADHAEVLDRQVGDVDALLVHPDPGQGILGGRGEEHVGRDLLESLDRVREVKAHARRGHFHADVDVFVFLRASGKQDGRDEDQRKDEDAFLILFHAFSPPSAGCAASHSAWRCARMAYSSSRIFSFRFPV